MTRTQIQLRDDQHDALKKRTSVLGVSLSAAIREAVDAWLLTHPGGDTTRSAAYKRAAACLGRFHSGSQDISRRHDEYLAEVWASPGPPKSTATPSRKKR
jgi:hypothetical protein